MPNNQPLNFESFRPTDPEAEYYKDLRRQQSQIKWEEGRQKREQEAKLVPLEEDAEFLSSFNKAFEDAEKAERTEIEQGRSDVKWEESREDRERRLAEQAKSDYEKEVEKQDKKLGQYLGTVAPGRRIGIENRVALDEYLSSTKPEELFDVEKFKANDVGELSKVRSSVENFGASLVLSSERVKDDEKAKMWNLSPDQQVSRILSKSNWGVAQSPDGKLVVDERFIDAVNSPSKENMKSENIARAIINNIKSITTREQGRTKDLSYLIPDVESLTNLVQNIRRQDRRTYEAYSKAGEKFPLPARQEDGEAPQVEGTKPLGEGEEGSSGDSSNLVNFVLDETARFFLQNPSALIELNARNAQVEGAEREEALAPYRKARELKDKLATSIATNAPGVTYADVRNELDDESSLARNALEEVYANDVPESVRESILARTTQLAQERQALVESDYQKAEKDAINEHLSSLGLDEGTVASVGVSGIAKKYLREAQDNDVSTVARAAVSNYQSTAGQALELGMGLGYDKPLNLGKWESRGNESVYALFDENGNQLGGDFRVDRIAARQKAEELGVSLDTYLDSLVLPLKQGNLLDSDETNTIMAWDPVNKKMVANATADSNPLAVYDTDLINRSADKAIADGADEATVNKWRDGLIRVAKEQAALTVDMLKDQYAAVEELIKSDLLPQSELAMKLAKMGPYDDFRDFYSQGKAQGKEDAQIIQDFVANEKDSQVILALMGATAKTMARWKSAGYTVANLTNEAASAIGLANRDIPKYQSLWSNLAKGEQSTQAILQRSGAMADWGAEIMNLAGQIGETVATGGVGRGANAFVKGVQIWGKNLALKATTQNMFRAGQIVSKLGGGAERFALRHPNFFTSSAVNAKVFGDAASDTFKNVAPASYNRAMEELNKNPETTNLPERTKMEMAQNVATTKGSVAAVAYGITSTLLNNRAGWVRMVRKSLGVKPTGSAISKLEKSLEGPGLLDWSVVRQLPGRAQVMSIAKQLGRISASAVEGGVEELADEALQWGWETAVQNGQIREEDIASERDVLEAASKIFILGAMGGEMGLAIQRMATSPAEIQARREKALEAQGLLASSLEESRKEDSSVSGAFVQALEAQLERSSEIADDAIVSQESAVKLLRNSGREETQQAVDSTASIMAQLPERARVEMNNFGEAWNKLGDDEAGKARLQFEFIQHMATDDTLTPQQKEMVGVAINELSKMPAVEVDVAAGEVNLPEGLDELATVEVVTEEAEAPTVAEEAPAVEAPAPEVARPTEETAIVESLNVDRDYGYNAPNPVPFIEQLNDWYLSNEPINEEIQKGVSSVLVDLELEDPDMFDFITEGKDEVDRATVRRLITVSNLTGPDAPLAINLEGKTEVHKANALLTDKSVWKDYNVEAPVRDSYWAADVYAAIGEDSLPIQDAVDDILLVEENEGVRTGIETIVGLIEEAGIPVNITSINADSNIAGLTQVDPESKAQYIAINASAANPETSVGEVILHELSHVLDNHLRSTNPDYAQRVADIEETIRSNWSNIKKEVERIKRTAVTDMDNITIDQFVAEMEYALFAKESENLLDTSREFLPNVLTNPIMGQVVAEGVIPFDAELEGWSNPENLARINLIGKGKFTRIVANLLNAIRSVLKSSKPVKGTASPANSMAIVAEPGTLSDPTRAPIVTPKLIDYKVNEVDTENVFITTRGVDPALFSNAQNFVGAGKAIVRAAKKKGGYTFDSRNSKKAKEFVSNYLSSIGQLNGRSERIKRFVQSSTKNMEANAKSKVIQAIVDYTGDIGNAMDPKVVRRIFAETQTKMDKAKAGLDAEVNAANDKFAKFVAERRTAIARAEGAAKILTGTEALNAVKSAIVQASKVAKETPVVATDNPMAVAAEQFRQAQEKLTPAFQNVYGAVDESVKSEVNAMYDAALKAIAEELSATYKDSKQILEGLVSLGGLEGVGSVDDLESIITSVISANRMALLKKDVEAVRAAKDIAKAREDRRKAIAVAEENYKALTRRGGMGKDGHWVSPGSIWVERNQALEAERLRKRNEYGLKREESRKVILSQPFGKRLMALLDDARRTIANNAVNIAHRRGAVELGTKVKDFSYLTRTFSATGKNGQVYAKAMMEVIDNHGKAKPEFNLLTTMLNDAIQSYMRENISRYNEGTSQLIANLYAMASVADTLGFEGREYHGFEGKEVWGEVNDYMLEGEALKESALKAIEAGKWDEVALMKRGDVSLARMLYKASELDSHLRSLPIGERSKVQASIRKAKENMKNIALDNYVLTSMGQSEGDLRSFLMGLDSEEQVVSALDIPYVDKTVVARIMGSKDENLRTRVKNTINYIRTCAALEMKRNGEGVSINPRDMGLLADGDVADGLIAEAKKVFRETLSKNRNDENILAMRKNLMDSELQILGMRGYSNIEDAFGTIQNTLAAQSRTYVNQVINKDITTSLIKHKVVAPEKDREKDIVLEFADKNSPLNGMFADRETALALYKTFAPSNGVLEAGDKMGNELVKYWKNDLQGLRKMGGFVSMLTLIKSPSATLRNMAGTVGQSLNAGALPTDRGTINGYMEVQEIIRDFAIASVLSGAGDLGLSKLANSEATVQAEDRLQKKLKKFQSLGLMDAGAANFMREAWKKGLLHEAVDAPVTSVEDQALFSSILEEVGGDEKLAKKVWNRTKGILNWTFIKPMEVMAEAYSIPDILAKVILFNTETYKVDKVVEAELKEAHYRKSRGQTLAPRMVDLLEAEAKKDLAQYKERRAADRVKNLLPTGARTPDWVNNVSVLGMPFFSFVYHTWQSMPYSISYGLEEMTAAGYEWKRGSKGKALTLYLDGVQKLTGSIASNAIMGSLVNMFLPLISRTIAGMFEGEDEQDKLEVLKSSSFTRWLARNAGLSADYDQNGELFFWYDKSSGNFFVQDGQYLMPYKTVGDTVGAFIELGWDAMTGKMPDKYKDSPVSSTLDFLESTVGSPSMLLQVIGSMYEASPRDSATLEEMGGVGEIPGAFVNALLMSLGMRPQVSLAGGKTLGWMERLSTAVRDNLPLYPAIVSGIQSFGDMNPDSTKVNWIMKNFGLGVRRNKNIEDVCRDGLAKHYKDFTNAMKNQRVFNPNIYKEGWSEEQMREVMERDKGVVVDKAVKLANCYQILHGFLKGMGESDPDVILDAAVDAAGISKTTMDALLDGEAKPILSPQRMEGLEESAERILRRKDTPEPVKEQLGLQLKLAEEALEVNPEDISAFLENPEQVAEKVEAEKL
jgi:hypothetical protein